MVGNGTRHIKIGECFFLFVLIKRGGFEGRGESPNQNDAKGSLAKYFFFQRNWGAKVFVI